MLGMTFDIAEEKRKRHRRTATEIARHYRCPVEDCPKSYGYISKQIKQLNKIVYRSEGSLNQHIKLKHPEIYSQMSVNNQNIGGLSKRGSSIDDDDGRSINTDSQRDNMSDEDEQSELIEQ